MKKYFLKKHQRMKKDLVFQIYKVIVDYTDETVDMEMKKYKDA